MQSDHMLPLPSRKDRTDLRLGNFEEPAKHRVRDNSRPVELSNLNNLFLCKLGLGFCFSDRSARTPFCFAVAHVVQLCPAKKVFGVAARRIVAMVANLLSFWNRSVGKLISHPVSHAPAAFLCPRRKNAVTAVVNFSKPWPALIWPQALDLFPKSFREWGKNYFLPTSESAMLLDGNRGKIGMWVFECHEVGFCGLKGGMSNSTS